jgi:hypothetical protein
VKKIWSFHKKKSSIEAWMDLTNNRKQERKRYAPQNKKKKKNHFSCLHRVNLLVWKVIMPLCCFVFRV